MKIGFLIILGFSYFHTEKDAPNIHRAFQNVCKASEVKISGLYIVMIQRLQNALQNSLLTALYFKALA